MRILIIEDDPDLADTLRQGLVEAGYSVDVSNDGAEGLAKAMHTDYDALVLDLMLPQLSGSEVLCKLRETKQTPVLVLTARDTAEDKILNLNNGADDYLTKPFVFDELIARLQSLIRRSNNHPSPLVKHGSIQLNTAARTVEKEGKPVEIVGKEYSILELLMVNTGKVVSRTLIYEHVYGEDDDTLSNVVDVYICNLRKKLGNELIQTRRGEGYLIKELVSENVV